MESDMAAVVCGPGSCRDHRRSSRDGWGLDLYSVDVEVRAIEQWHCNYCKSFFFVDKYSSSLITNPDYCPFCGKIGLVLTRE